MNGKTEAKPDVCTSPIEFLTLKHGQHAPDSQEYCAVEAAVCRFTKGKKHSDNPKDCNGSHGIGRMMIRLNDRWDDERRQCLKPFVDRLPNSKGTDAQERRRAFMAADWACRTCLPLLLDARGDAEAAARLRAMPELVDKASADAARAVVVPIRDGLWEKRIAAYAAAYAAAAADAAADAAYAAAAAAAYAAAADAAAAAAYAAAGLRAVREVIDASALELLNRLFLVTESTHG